MDSGFHEAGGAAAEQLWEQAQAAAIHKLRTSHAFVLYCVEPDKEEDEDEEVGMDATFCVAHRPQYDSDGLYAMLLPRAVYELYELMRELGRRP